MTDEPRFLQQCHDHIAKGAREANAARWSSANMLEAYEAGRRAGLRPTAEEILSYFRERDSHDD